MQLCVLGPVLVGGAAPAGAKERALLARLLVEPGAPVSPEALIEAAWPGPRPDGVTRSLHVRLARLRSVLGPDALVREPAGYRLDVEPEAVDAQRFCAMAAQAQTLETCDAVLALWRGEPFADVAAADDATAAEARRLHAVRDRLRRTRAAALRELGRPDEAAHELEALVEEDPLCEDLVCDLMSARYAAGRQAEALEAYRELAGRLADVGLTPSPEVRELELRILGHAEDLQDAPAPVPRRPPTNVGERITGVVGREEELGLVASALRDHRVVTLVGPGGVGKTTLAAEAARRLLEDRASGAWLVELGPLRAPAEVLPAVGTTMGLRRVGTGGRSGDLDALGVVRERLRDERVLLVLDGAEHLVPALGAVVCDLAGAGAGVAVLVTSRRPLGLPGEAVVRLAPLTVPEPDATSPEAIAATAAGRLFAERARAARPGWELREADAAAVAAICRRLDGLPLALELAAARLHALSPAEIAARLETGVSVLGRGTLDASIEASHALLDADEQELFRRLSVFAGPFGLEDAEQVGGGDGLDPAAVVDLLVALTDHSMVQAEGEPRRRYRMLEALRDHGRARLAGPAAEAAARRHATHLAHVAATTAARIDWDGAEAVGDPLVPYQWDLDAAFGWALAREETDVGLDLAVGLGALHHLFGTVTLGRELLERALALPGGEPLRRLEALRWQAALLLSELRLPAAAAALEQARELAATHGGPAHADRLLVLDAQLALCDGDLDTAARRGEGLYERAMARGERHTAGFAAWTRGTVARMRGEADVALEHFRAACELMREVLDVCALDNCAAALAEAAVAAGREAEAAQVCDGTLGCAPTRPLGERNTFLLHEAALASARAGDLERASLLARSAATGARRDPVSIGPWHAPAARGDVALAAGDRAAARDEYEEALTLALRVRAEVGSSLPVEARLALSHLRLAGLADDGAQAAGHATRALEHARASRAPAIVAAAEQAAAPAAAAR